MNKRAEEIVYELTFGGQEWRRPLDRGTVARERGQRCDAGERRPRQPRI